MDGFKHTSIPPLTLTPNLKAIYIYGDPIKATASLFRRNYHHAHARTITGKTLPKNMTLEEYATQLEDCFQFENHYYNWRNRDTAYPILFIKYNAIWESIDAIFDFLELPSNLKSKFPAKKKRQSSIESSPQSIINDLNQLYGKFKEEVEKSPDFEIKPSKSFSYIKKLPLIPRSLLVNQQTVYPKLVLNSFLRKNNQ